MVAVYPSKHPLQDFGPEIGGRRLPQGGPIPQTLRYNILLSIHALCFKVKDVSPTIAAIYGLLNNDTGSQR